MISKKDLETIKRDPSQIDDVLKSKYVRLSAAVIATLAGFGLGVVLGLILSNL